MKILTPQNTQGGHVKIYFEDRDVSNLCFYAEVPDTPGIETQGKVKMYIGKKVGKVITIDVDPQTGEPLFVEKEGIVRWEPANWEPVP